MDVKTFAQQWWSQTDLNYRFDVREWMSKSYTDPLSFWEELLTYYRDDPESVSQTSPLQAYDFYSDCIVQHKGRNTIALKVIQAEGGAEKWSYEEIDEMVEAQASFWKPEYRLEPGKTVALILPQGLPFVVGLMTALRLGLIVCVLPFQDRFFPPSQLQKAVETLAPDLIVTLAGEEKHFESQGDVLELDLSLEKQTPSSIETHVYLANDTVQKHFNPYSLKEEQIHLLEAMRSYLIPLRDTLLALHLKRSMAWARPLSSVFREEPCCTLMALLVGATIVHVPDDILFHHPQVLKDEPIDVLGVSFPLQQLWIKTPGSPSSKLKVWYRDPLCGTDHNWRAFNELNGLQKVPSAQLLIDKERGGTILFSQPKPLEKVIFMHPSLGMSWNLQKINANGADAVGGFGLFHVEPAGKDHLIIAQIGDEWTICGAISPLNEGYFYPIREIEEKMKSLDFVQTCMVVMEPHPQHFHNKQFILLVFVSPKERNSLQQKKEDWKGQLRHLIQTSIGEAFLPSEVLFYSFYPKMENKEIHRNWVETQYQRGHLFLKQKRPIYHNLNKLRQAVYENMAYKS